ncbi:acetyl-CoA acetyltransferase [Porphyrobacter algicida]|uniref:Acetyl-CoA acetyltransferase n=1 Tax=Qipengyuania algicida TaxID=1836209 RepID=A0A845AL91_9SPHN|nr:acetyl-CoA acetyltransferase [Qipengyuania algicida]MXP29933.1 acetyl-CoA acetyltransferase [Qipengyuania algicida]
MAGEEERIPVIVGVGQINDRPATPQDGLDPVGLMAQALRRADSDAGGGWLNRCDSLAVVSQLAWPQLNPLDGTLAQVLGMSPAHREQTDKPNGDSPIRLLHEAANRIGAGEASVCVVVGGEALRTAGQFAALQPREDGAKPNALRDATHRVRRGYAQSHGLVVPVDVYPLYENAGRAARGETLAEGQAESGKMWTGMSRIAERCEKAWLRKAATPEEIVTPTKSNRPIAFPYTKLQVANASVNQGAGFLVTSLAEARRRGVAEEQLVFIGHGAAAHESENFLERDGFTGSPSLAVSIERTLALNGVGAGDLDLVELYSCFPCVPKMARRVLGWPLDKPITVFGGLTFGGGPIGNYMSHAVCCMVERLREKRGPKQAMRGLLFANGGYATHNHTILLSNQPTGASFPQDFDHQAEADAQRGPIPELDRVYAGPATIETYTVHYARDGSPKLGTIVARTPQGGRTLAVVAGDDAPLIEWLTSGEYEPVGSAGRIARHDPDAPGIWSLE